MHVHTYTYEKWTQMYTEYEYPLFDEMQRSIQCDDHENCVWTMIKQWN